MQCTSVDPPVPGWWPLSHPVLFAWNHQIVHKQVMTVLSLTLLHIVPLVSLTYLNYAIISAIRWTLIIAIIVITIITPSSWLPSLSSFSPLSSSRYNNQITIIITRARSTRLSSLNSKQRRDLVTSPSLQITLIIIFLFMCIWSLLTSHANYHFCDSGPDLSDSGPVFCDFCP